jgi:hypothetical protein
MLPLCNRYLGETGAVEYQHRLLLGGCNRCGLVQLLNEPVPLEEIRPRYHWLTYREPEEHLDHLAGTLATLPGITNGSVFCGISYKDDSLLERMKARGFSETWRIHPEEDLNIQAAGAGVESVQYRLEKTRCAEAADRYGQADVVIARHILEHAYDVRRLLNALRALLKPGGYLVLEVPDCSRALETRDYSTLWEEHTLYFTPETFKAFCAPIGLELTAFEVVSYALENSIIGIARFKESSSGIHAEKEMLEAEKSRALVFGTDFTARRAKLRNRLAEFRASQGKIALLGAGHLSCMFINLFDLKDYLEFVVDDDPNKQGLLMPGSRLTIRGSSALVEEGIRLCLLGVNPQIEDLLVQKQKRFFEHGGALASIFFASKRSLAI